MERIKLILSAILAYTTMYLVATAEPVEDKQALLDFILNVYHSQNLNWDVTIPACNNWTGITCNHDESRIIAVQLPGFGFKGRIATNTLGQLSALEILSLGSNGFRGTFPSDLLKLGNLTALYFQSNNLEGPLPLNILVWEKLSVLNLSNNNFNGSIPSSISNSTRLTALNLANNSLSGDVPDLDIPTLQLLDLSNNCLSGIVPPSLLRFPSSAFTGNGISPRNSSSPVQSVPNKCSLGIVISGCAVVFVATTLLLAFAIRKSEDNESTTEKNEVSISSSMPSLNENERIIFFEGCNLVFDLEDLLRASAEVLGKGAFGTTYKVALEDTTTIAVKRLNGVNVGRSEFEQQMEIVRNIRHDNIVPLRAYYYSEDEKLMVYDYCNRGSISALLHAKRGENKTSLDWETRLKIAIGVARGIAHIHSQSNRKLIHGNIKASNIFLNSQLYGCISDLGLAKLTSPVSPLVARSGYRAPEVTNTRKVSQASDVYSYGVFLLELLTGRSPVHVSGGGEEVIHLARWVQSVIRDEWTGEVFDVELLRYPDIEEEMVAMLMIGLSCVERVAEQRPKIGDVAKIVEEIRVLDV